MPNFTSISVSSAPVPAQLATSQSILNTPSAFVASLALGYSILVTVLNHLQSKSRLKEERAYKRDYAFYDALVLHGCRGFLDFASCAHIEIQNLFQAARSNQPPAPPSRAQIEKSLSALYKANSKLEDEILLLVSGFSRELKIELGEIVEAYYDQMTKIFSDFSQPEITIEFASKQHAEYIRHTEKYIDGIFALIRDACPTKK